MRGRGRGHFHRGNQFAPQGMKRSWAGNVNIDLEYDMMRNCFKTMAPNIAKEYSIETLMSAEFQAGIELDELGKEIALALGETDPATVAKIVLAVGEEKVRKFRVVVLLKRSRHVCNVSLMLNSLWKYYERLNLLVSPAFRLKRALSAQIIRWSALKFQKQFR